MKQGAQSKAISGRDRKRVDALRLMASMSVLCAVPAVSHFGARHLVSKPHPGLSHAKPKSFVSVGFRGARHRYTLLNQMLVNSNFHCTILRAHPPQIRAVEWGRGSIPKWQKAGDKQRIAPPVKEQTSDTSPPATGRAVPL
jgi:hypothetical protein